MPCINIMKTTTMDYKSTFFMLNKLAKSHEHTVA